MGIQEICEVGLAKLSALYKNNMPSAEPCKILTGTCAGEAIKSEDELWSKQRNLEQDGIYSPYLMLVKRMGLGYLARTVIELAALCSYYIEYAEMLENDTGTRGATIELAAKTVEVMTGTQPDLYEKRQAFSTVTMLLATEGEGKPFYKRLMSMDERIILYFEDDTKPDVAIDFCSEYYRGRPVPEMFIREELVPRVCMALKRGGRSMLQIIGQQGTGKRHLLKRACIELDLGLVLVDTKKLCILDQADISICMWRIRREMMLSQLAVCFYGLEGVLSESANSSERLFLSSCAETLVDQLTLPVCVCTDERVSMIPEIKNAYVETIELKPFSRAERIELWKGFGAQFHLARDVDCIEAASKYRLNAMQIRLAVQRLAFSPTPGNTGKAVSKVELEAAVCAVLPKLSLGYMQKPDIDYTFDDLKLPADQKKLLLSVCAHVSRRHKVFDEWGMESVYKYGKTVAVLFSGPPGTGKTMAAHVIANTLSIPMYTIDLSQVVDKYIGETEKKLEAIFNTAQMTGSILFFDEADAIFGKRSEVSDAKDRYANTEVSYILQRIEQYDGIVILASNFKKNIDEAFMRRMRYVIDFNLPGEEIRRQLWEGSFAKEVPTEDIDFTYLAKNFEFSGGTIRNIVLNAVFIAADEEVSVCMRHILDSIREESRKHGELMLKQDFGEYAYYI